MSAEHKLDADAFMRKYLERPSDATARLVFADWLEETGEPHNAAWAHFIRLKVEADRYPLNSPTRHEIERHAGQYAVHIRARLAIPAKLFVGYPKSLLELLPSQNITVRLAEFEVPREVLELVRASVARDHLILPLDAQGRALLIAAVDPNDLDLTEKVQFTLSRELILVAADRDDLREAIDREYGAAETEAVDSELVAFTDTAGPHARMPSPINFLDGDDTVIVQLLNMIIHEAVNRRADAVHFSPGPGGIIVRYHIDGAWRDHPDRVPLRLLRRLVARLAILAGNSPEWASSDPPSPDPMTGEALLRVHGVQFGVRVAIQPSPDGPSAHITLHRVPVVVEDR